MNDIAGVYSRTDGYEQVTAPSSGEFYYRLMEPSPSNLYGLTPGGTYTLSGSASHTSGELKFRAQYSTNGSSWYVPDDISDLGIPVSDGSVFKPFSYTFTIPANATGVYISLQNYDYTAGGLFRFKSMKLEKGSVATPWSPAPSDLAIVTQVQQITASIDGLQSTVTNKADKSQITQLLNLVQSKVNSSDFNSKVTQLSTDINARVTKGDLLSQFNLEAGRTLIQSQKIYLDADSVIMGPNTRAFIPSAAITNIDADKINAGTMNGVELRQVATNGRTIDIKDGNIVISSNDSSSGRITFVNGGKVTKVFNAKGDLETLDQYLTLFDFKSSDVNSLNPIPYFSVVNTGEIGSGDAKIQFDHSWIDGDSWWTKSAGVTFGRTYDGAGGSNDYAEIYAKSFNQNSELSAKTRIEKLDKKEALDKIMQDDMYTYQYKSDVRDGVPKRYASFIIDNVNDVAQYREPAEFLSANRHGRDDGTQLAYLIAAFQYQHGIIEEMQKEIEELKQGTAEK